MTRRMKKSRLILSTLILLTLQACSTNLAIDRTPEADTGRMNQKLVTSQSTMLATANPYASAAGQRVLQRGGSAIDAAIAVNMVLTLVEPQSSGLGGGSFILYWDEQERTLHTYDGRETAPLNVRPDLFYDAGKPLDFQQAVAGGRAVGVPGLLKNLQLVHSKHGRLSWADLFQDAIELAEKGFIVSQRLNQLLSGSARIKLMRNPAAYQYFYPQGVAVQAGQRLTNPQLADTLRLIAAQGPDTFYAGDLARQMVQAVRTDANPGQLSMADLAGYKAIERQPVCQTFYHYKVCGMGPPSSGGLSLLQMLSLLEYANIDRQQPGSVQALHLFAQAGRLAFADRNRYIADPDFVEVPAQGLLDPGYLKQRAELIDPLRDSGKKSAGTPPGLTGAQSTDGYNPEQPGTSHMSIIDRYGNALSQTASIEQGFGTGLMVGGFLLNNELTDFSFAWQDQAGQDQAGQAIANRVQSGKRPRSSMAPTLVFDDKDRLLMVIGSPGGSRIIPYVTRTIINSLVWKQDIQTAISQPHALHLNGSSLDLEKGTLLENYREEFERRGYQVNIRDLNSGLHGIIRTENGLEGGADPRREGQVLGD